MRYAATRQAHSRAHAERTITDRDRSTKEQNARWRGRCVTSLLDSQGKSSQRLDVGLVPDSATLPSAANLAAFSTLW